MSGAVREVLAYFGVELDKKGLHEADEGIEGVIGKVKGFAAAIGGPLVLGEIREFVMGLAEQAEAVKKQSVLLGMSTTELQTWQGAASLAGSSADALAGAFRMMGRGIGNGTGPAAQALRRWGVQLKDSNGQMRSQGDLFEDAADHIASIQDPIKRNAAGMEIFKRSWSQIAPLVMKGGEGIRKLRDEVGELGVAFDEGFIEQSEKVVEEQKKLDIGWQGIKVQVAAVLLPVLLSLMQQFVHLVPEIKKLFAHTEILRVGMMLLAAKGLFFLSNTLGPLGGGFRTLLTRALPLVAAFLLIEDFFVFMKGGDSEIGALIDKIFGPGQANKVRDEIKGIWTEFEAFFDKLQKDPEGASDDWRLFWSTLKKDAKSTFGDTLGGVLTDFIDDYQVKLDIMTGGWDNGLAKMSAGLDKWVIMAKAAGYDVLYFFGFIGAAIGDVFGTAWNAIVSELQIAVETMRAVASKIPGFGDMAKSLEGVGADLEGVKAKSLIGVVSEEASATNDRLTAQYAQADFGMHNNAIRKGVISNVNEETGTGTREGATNNDIKVEIHVPPGTDAETARRAGAAAKEGVSKGLDEAERRKLQAALVQGKG